MTLLNLDPLALSQGAQSVLQFVMVGILALWLTSIDIPKPPDSVRTAGQIEFLFGAIMIILALMKLRVEGLGILAEWTSTHLTLLCVFGIAWMVLAVSLYKGSRTARRLCLVLSIVRASGVVGLAFSFVRTSVVIGLLFSLPSIYLLYVPQSARNHFARKELSQENNGSE